MRQRNLAIFGREVEMGADVRHVPSHGQETLRIMYGQSVFHEGPAGIPSACCSSSGPLTRLHALQASGPWTFCKTAPANPPSPCVAAVDRFWTANGAVAACLGPAVPLVEPWKLSSDHQVRRGLYQPVAVTAWGVQQGRNHGPRALAAKGISTVC